MAAERGVRVIPIRPAQEAQGSAAGGSSSESGTHGLAGQLSALPPLSLYVHLPWCLRKCPYCDFNSHEQVPDRDLQARYRQALLLDLEHTLPQVWGRTVHSIFIGGGTPSLFDPDEIEALLGGIRARLRLEPGCEITLEANPGTFERERFRAYAQAGVTRLSIGVQSFNDAALKALGRVHDAAQARAAMEEAAASFTTWNLDLMYALPGQTLQDLEADLDVALSCRPPHLSIYHLTVEANTRFALQPPPDLPDDDLASEMLDLIIERTQAQGLRRYEVSAFARDGHRCTHNLNYWRYGDYIGIGAGAHGKISFPDRIMRPVRWREPRTWMQATERGEPVSNEKAVPLEERTFEFMLNGLRLVDGVSLRTLVERTGVPTTAVAAALQQAQARGMIEREGEVIRATPRGLDFLSDLQALFLPD